MDSLIRQAISGKKLLEFYYDGGVRVVEPHCYGLTTADNVGLRAYQVRGHSSSGNGVGMKMFDMGKATNVKLVEETSLAPRNIYKKGDKGMKEIYCEL